MGGTPISFLLLLDSTNHFLAPSLKFEFRTSGYESGWVRKCKSPDPNCGSGNTHQQKYKHSPMIEGAAFAADEPIGPKRLQRGCMYLALLAWRHLVCDLDSMCVCGEYYISTTFEIQFNCTYAITFKFEFEALIRSF